MSTVQRFVAVTLWIASAAAPIMTASAQSIDVPAARAAFSHANSSPTKMLGIFGEWRCMAR